MKSPLRSLSRSCFITLAANLPRIDYELSILLRSALRLPLASRASRTEWRRFEAFITPRRPPCDRNASPSGTTRCDGQRVIPREKIRDQRGVQFFQPWLRSPESRVVAFISIRYCERTDCVTSRRRSLWKNDATDTSLVCLSSLEVFASPIVITNDQSLSVRNASLEKLSALKKRDTIV